MLRLPDPADAEALMRIHEDPEALKHVHHGAGSEGLAHALRMVTRMTEHWHQRGYGPWVVVERATGQVIGRVGLWNPEGWPDLELGWIILRSHWGQGFATEAAAAALAWTWDHVQTDHVISLIEPDNLASIRVAEKLGEQVEGTDHFNGKELFRYVARRP